jgi:hypothetical protein
MAYLTAFFLTLGCGPSVLSRSATLHLVYIPCVSFLLLYLWTYWLVDASKYFTFPLTFEKAQPAITAPVSAQFFFALF